MRGIQDQEVEQVPDMSNARMTVRDISPGTGAQQVEGEPYPGQAEGRRQNVTAITKVSHCPTL